MGDIISLVFSGGIVWYYYNHMEENSYLKNVGIYALVSLISTMLSNLVNEGKPMVIASIVGAILGGLISVKIFEYAKNHTKSFLGYFILSFLLSVLVGMLIGFAIVFILGMIFVGVLF